MSDAPENLTLRLLQDIRSKQDEQSAVLDGLRRDFDELRHSVVYSLGLGTTEHLKNKEQDARLNDQNARMDRLFKKVEELLTEGSR